MTTSTDEQLKHAIEESRTLRHLPARWELAVLRAQTLPATEDRLTAIYNATDDLILFAARGVSEESEGFFAQMNFPAAEAERKA